jgi:hypothetical protein
MQGDPIRREGERWLAWTVLGVGGCVFVLALLQIAEVVDAPDTVQMLTGLAVVLCSTMVLVGRHREPPAG